MERRNFIKLSALGAAGILGTQIISANDAPKKFAPEIEEITVVELQAQLKSGEISSREITRQYLKRIEQIDSKLNSVIETNPDWLK